MEKIIMMLFDELNRPSKKKRKKKSKKKDDNNIKIKDKGREKYN